MLKHGTNQRGKHQQRFLHFLWYSATCQVEQHNTPRQNPTPKNIHSKQTCKQIKKNQTRCQHDSQNNSKMKPKWTHKWSQNGPGDPPQTRCKKGTPSCGPRLPNTTPESLFTLKKTMNRRGCFFLFSKTPRTSQPASKQLFLQIPVASAHLRFLTLPLLKLPPILK